MPTTRLDQLHNSGPFSTWGTQLSKALSRVLTAILELSRAAILQEPMDQKQGCMLTGMHIVYMRYKQERLTEPDATVAGLTVLVVVRVNSGYDTTFIFE